MEYFLIIIFVYLALATYLYFNQRSMIYFPDATRYDPTQIGVPFTQIIKVKTDDGLDLEGWYYPPADNHHPVILYFHGNGGSAAGRVPKILPFITKGYGVLLAEYRGYGGNPGFPSETGFIADGHAYIKYLQSQNISPDHIILYGESIGTGVAVKMAGEYETAGLVLESPYSSIADVAQSKYYIMPVRLLLKDRFDSFSLIKGIKGPKLFIHATNDQIIPIRFSRRLFEEASEPKTFISIDSASHNDLYDHGAALHVLEFLSKIPKPAKE